jgi:hypothetical protein
VRRVAGVKRDHRPMIVTFFAVLCAASSTAVTLCAVSRTHYPIIGVVNTAMVDGSPVTIVTPCAEIAKIISGGHGPAEGPSVYSPSEQKDIVRTVGFVAVKA